MAFDDLVKAYPLNTVDKKVNMVHTLLKGDALNRFQNAYCTAAGSDKEKYIAVLHQTGIQYFRGDAQAWRHQRNYMRYSLHMSGFTVLSFKLRLIELNKYLMYFPIPKGLKKVMSLP